MWRIILCVFLIFFLGGCKQSQNSFEKPVSSNKYARGFSIEEMDRGITRLTVYDPWEKARNIEIQYYLLDKNTEVPDSFSDKKIIRTPIERIICMSTSHLGFIDVLNEEKSVVGVSGGGYVSNEEIEKRIKSREVVDVGYGQNLNYEVIVNSQPDLVMLYGVGSEVTSYSQKLEELGIPAIMNAEYLEENPLGKAEWIKFVGALFQKEEEAEQFFNTIESNYITLKEQVAKETNHPKVLVGSPYRDSWWVPGGNSYMANLIRDAGGDYLGKENSSHESYVISFENALIWGNGADVWINMGSMSTNEEIIATDQRFSNFRVLEEGRLFNNNKRMSENGGNDFWESGTVYPDLILQDLVAIFYPEIFSGNLTYYREVK